MKVVQKFVNQAAIDYARGLLERCESGEVLCVTALEEFDGGSYRVTGSDSKNRFTTVGMLMAAIQNRLSHEE
jgi:hypothetical protein